jgi:hypothetical protein
MSSAETIDVLNRLVVIHHRSLAVYLGYASPTWHRGDDRARETLRMIAEDARETVDRLGEMILDEGGTVDYGAFPMRFTAYHDLSFSYLLDRLIELQRKAVNDIAECVDELSHAPMARAMAEDALGAAKGHLESLEELKQSESATA